MSSEQPSSREQVSTALKMSQEPKDRLWAAIYVMVLLVFLLGVIMVASTVMTRNTLITGRQLGFERSAVSCLTLVIDNDRDFDLPPHCLRDEIVIYYPPEVCKEFYPNSDLCGQSWEEG